MTRPYLATFAHINYWAKTPEDFLEKFKVALNDEDDDEKYYHWIFEYGTDRPQIYYAFIKLWSFKTCSNFESITDAFVDICSDYILSHPDELPNPSEPIVVDLDYWNGPVGNVNLTTPFDEAAPRHMLIETIDCMLESIHEMCVGNFGGKFSAMVKHVLTKLVYATTNNRDTTGNVPHFRL